MAQRPPRRRPGPGDARALRRRLILAHGDRSITHGDAVHRAHRVTRLAFARELDETVPSRSALAPSRDLHSGDAVALGEQGAELVVIGQTGHLTGNIKTPTLEIVEGAHFKGSVDMDGGASKTSSPVLRDNAAPAIPKPNGAAKPVGVA